MINQSNAAAETLELALRASGLGTWDLDVSTGELNWSHRCKAIFGVPVEQPLRYNDFLDRLHPEERSWVNDVVQKALDPAGSGEYDIEYRIVRPDGDTRWAAARGEAIFGQVGGRKAAVRFIGTIQDITKRKAAEQEALAIARRLSLAMETGRMASWHWDTVTGGIFWDEGSIWTYGRPPSEMVVPEVIFTYLHKDDQERVRRDLIPVLQGTGDYQSEFRVVWPDSSLHWIQAFGRAVQDAEGKPVGVVGVNINVTEQKQAETATILRQQFLLTLSDRQQQSKDPRDMLEVTSEMLGRHLSAGRVGYAEVLQDGRNFALNTGWVRGEMERLSGLFLLDDFGLEVSTRFHQGKDLVFTDAHADLSAEEASPFTAMNIRAAIVMPLMREAELRGMLYVNEAVPREWTPAEISLVREVAERTAESVGRAQIEAELRLGAERLRLATSAAQGMGVFDWHIKIDRLYGDEAFSKLWGVTKEEGFAGIAIERVVALMHPEDQSRVQLAIQGAMRDGGDYTIDYRVGSRTESRWIAARGCCFLDESGNAERFPGVVLDITERKRMEDDLRVSEAKVRLAVETAKMGTWSLNLVSKEFHTSSVCKQNYGREATDEFSYADLLESVHPEDRQAMQEAVRQAIENDTDYRCDYRIVWPDGSPNWVIASGRLLPRASENEEPTMVGVSLKVTDQKLAEAALIQNEKLAAVGRLASSIAHEINNPLESVTNLLYLANQTEQREELQSYLALADTELRRASAITNHTLRFHKQSSKPVSIDARDLIAGVLTVHDSRIRNNRVTIERRDRTQLQVFCFDGEIRQVLGNLVGNAADAMSGIGGKLIVRSREGHDWSSGRTGIVMTVADTGSGMSEKTKAKLFDAFYSTKGIGGTGLGLWISKDIVDRHHGRLSVRSSQKTGASGTVFSLFLPFDAVSR